MAAVLKDSNVLRFSKSISRTSITSRAYSLCHDQESRNINSLFASWKVSSGSLRIDSAHLRPRTGRCFSASSAIRIDKARYDKLRLDPVALNAYRAKCAQERKANYDKVRKDPGAWKIYAAHQAESLERHVFGNPEVRRKKNKFAKESNARLASTQENFRLSRSLYDWIYLFSWVRNAMPWKSHQPLLYDEPVEHYCNGCQLVRRNGVKLWWKSKAVLSGESQVNMSKEAQYLCHSCYTKQRPWSEVMPEGYEDVNSLKALVARRNQLDGTSVEINLQKDETLSRKEKIVAWCRNHDWVRQLPWPTHRPLLFEQKMELRCTNCLYAKRRPLLLWWQNAKGTYICSACYTKPDWSEIMPKGYEDARSTKDLRARKQQLGQVASGHANTFSHTPSSNHRQIGSKLAQATLTRPTSSPPTSVHSPTSRKFSSTSVASVSKERYAKLRADPVQYERQLEHQRVYSARRRSRLRSDKEAFRAYREQVNACNLKRRDEDPAHRERKKTRERIRYTKVAHQPAYRQSKFITSLLTHYPWSRAGLPWKSHLPLVSARPIERYCNGCDLIRIGGLKLWWRKIDAAETKSQPDSQSFLCHGCYFPKNDWACAMPEGYEDVKSIKELVARKEQLDGPPESGKYGKGESAFRADALTYWCQHEWIRHLPWKIHQPVLYEQKVYDRCARCEPARHISRKLWWRSPTETICNLCHAKQDWNESMPHGYENVRTMKELRARKKQLDEGEPEVKSQHKK